MGNNLMGNREASNNGLDKPIYGRARPNVMFEDLPEDIQRTILSKLPLKEVVRTSILSSKWRYMWLICSKLSFNGSELCGSNGCKQKFIDNVNGVLQKCHGNVVEELTVKIGIDSILVDHLNNWVSFAVSSRAKFLAFDLVPISFWRRDDRYIFPFQLLDKESIFRLQTIHLCFVSLKPPSQFGGFPNLRKLELTLLHATGKDLRDVLSSCCNLEWIRMDRCHLNDELKVDCPLSHLLHLQVIYCNLTKIELHAVNLATFVYRGDLRPIILNHSTKLDNVDISFMRAIFQHGLTALLNGLPNMQSLTFQIYLLQVEMQWLWDSPCKFSRLRHVQFFMNVKPEDADKILCLVSFLRAAPLIERLEVHFGPYDLWFANVGPVRQELGQCQYDYLKSMYMTGYKATRGQLEFLLHIVESAPLLEVLTVDTSRDVADHSDQIIRCCLRQKRSPRVKFCVLR